MCAVRIKLQTALVRMDVMDAAWNEGRESGREVRQQSVCAESEDGAAAFPLRLALRRRALALLPDHSNDGAARVSRRAVG